MRLCAICKRTERELQDVPLYPQMPSISGPWFACGTCIYAAEREQKPERGPLQLFEDEEEGER
jgi:hypothetical protein